MLKDILRYLKVNKINFDDPDKGENKIAFDNLTHFIQMKE